MQGPLPWLDMLVKEIYGFEDIWWIMSTEEKENRKLDPTFRTLSMFLKETKTIKIHYITSSNGRRLTSSVLSQKRFTKISRGFTFAYSGIGTLNFAYFSLQSHGLQTHRNEKNSETQKQRLPALSFAAEFWAEGISPNEKKY